MPNPYHIRSYVEDGFYHIFNRGVNKDLLFRDEGDYAVFIFFLANALQERNTGLFERRKNFFGLVSLHCYCLMPNHFHFLLQELRSGAIISLMRSITISYSMYFNKKYKHAGTIYEGKYKAKMIDSDEYLMHVSRYIHLNPKDLGVNPFVYPYSSIHSYINPKPNQSWVNTEFITILIDQNNLADAYKQFMLNDEKYDPRDFSFE